MQGIFIKGVRPKSKKDVKTVLAVEPSAIYFEATSIFGNEYEGSAADMKDGQSISFVGPDPYRKRNFYGTITKVGGRLIMK